MALSRTDYGAWRSPATGTWRLRQTMTATVNASARTATITSSVWLEPDAYSALYDSSCHHYQTIGGSVTYNGWLNRSASPGSPVLVLSNSRTFSYNAEGALSVYGYAKITNSYIGEHWVEATLVVDRIAPVAPSSLKVTAVSGGEHKLDWSRNATYSQVQIDRRVNGGSWERVATLNSNAQTWTDASTAPGNKYEWRVRGVAGGPASSWSNTVSALVPASPVTGLAVSRGSDTQHTVSWAESRTVVVQRQANEDAWVEVARPSSAIKTWTDTGTVGNRRYRYRVAVLSPGGQSGFAESSYFYTTPAKPTGVSAARVGDDIEVSASGLPPYYTGFNIEDDGTAVASAVTLPWTHVSPSNAVTHKYRVQAVRSSGTSNNVSLVSEWSDYSQTVQLAAPPNPPTNLSPNGVDRAVGETVLSWQHNPVDSSAQDAYELRHRPAGGAWTTVSGTTASTRSVSLPVNNFEWQVRTKGVHPTWSAWSAVASFTVINLPTVAVDVDDPYDRPTVSVAWAYSQAQGRPQSSWRVRLLDAQGVIEHHSGTGATSTHTFKTLVEDGGTYIVEAEVATGTIWSPVGSTTFAADFTPPELPVADGSWNERSGAIDLSVAPGEGGIPVVTMSIERDIGKGWEPIYIGEAEPITLSDHESLSYGITTYRVMVFTVDGVSSHIIFGVEADSDAIWINGGAGYSIAARLPYSPQITVTAGRARALMQYSGRSKPVLYTGEHLSRVIDTGGLIHVDDDKNSSVEDMETLAQMAGVFLFRDPSGRHIYGAFDTIALSRNASRVWGYSFTFTETEEE